MMRVQLKLLKDKKGKEGKKCRPRGVAFVEFTEHQHALVALRVLNNNAGKVFIPQIYFTLSSEIVSICCTKGKPGVRFT